MVVGYWREVLSSDLAVPSDRPLGDLTAELTTMLGSADPEERDGIALPALRTWVRRGVYDDLLTGLGDGMAAGLGVGLGEDGTDTVFRRSASVRVLTEVLDRDTQERLVTGERVLRWGDQVVTWFLRERDLRGWVGDKGPADALRHGALALAALARSPHLGKAELTVLLDVVADRLVDADEAVLTRGEPDQLALATVEVLRRELVPLRVVEPWVARLEAHAARGGPTEEHHVRTVNCQAFLRALHLVAAIGQDPPPERADLVLVLVEALRNSNPHLLHIVGTSE